MKLTENHLRKIIRQELSSVLSETDDSVEKVIDRIEKELKKGRIQKHELDADEVQYYASKMGVRIDRDDEEEILYHFDNPKIY